MRRGRCGIAAPGIEARHRDPDVYVGRTVAKAHQELEARQAECDRDDAHEEEREADSSGPDFEI